MLTLSSRSLHDQTPLPRRLAPLELTAEPQDRRQVPRHASDLRILCQLGAGRAEHFWWLTSCVDVSSRGLSLVLGFAVKPGTLLSIVPWQLSEQFQGQGLKASVVRTQRQADGGWVVGASLLRKLSDYELHVLLSPRASVG